jgi:hypothetical protein
MLKTKRAGVNTYRDKITEEPGREATETLGCTQGAARHPHG